LALLTAVAALAGAGGYAAGSHEVTSAADELRTRAAIGEVFAAADCGSKCRIASLKREGGSIWRFYGVWKDGHSYCSLLDMDRFAELPNGDYTGLSSCP
jgi:hypothetical protein